MRPLLPIQTSTRFPTLRRGDGFENRLRRMMEEAFGELEEIGWHPAVEVTETADELTLTAEFPGMKVEDVEIELEDDVLTLRGEKKEEERDEEKTEGEVTYRVTERRYGEFSRSFTVPSTVDADAIEASFEDGVLTVHMPKTAESRGRKIEVKG